MEESATREEKKTTYCTIQTTPYNDPNPSFAQKWWELGSHCGKSSIKALLENCILLGAEDE